MKPENVPASVKYHVVEHAELLENLNLKDKLVMEGRDLTKQIEDLEEARNKVGLQIQKLKDKIIPVAEELVKPVMEEFDMLTRTFPEVDKDGNQTGKVIMEYIDQVEDFREALREKMKGGKSLNKVAEEMQEEAKKMDEQAQTNENQNTSN
jgi:hypothetical protein